MSIVESLKRLFDPATARQEAAERRAEREQPERDDAGGPGKLYECRVCHHVGPEPTFCPSCLAGTMQPTRAVAPAAASPATPAQGDALPPVELPFDGTLDLHTFSPPDVKLLLPEYLEGCVERGLTQLRIVHGKGTGAMRRTVQAMLGRNPRVESFRTAGEDAGGWGATLVTLKVRDKEEGER